MNQSENVVSFQEVKQDTISRRVLLRKLQPKIRDLTNKHMQKVMQGMFDNADDTLFKMAESATEGVDKNLYIDSMRIVRLQRKLIEKTFFEELSQCFDNYEQDIKPAKTFATEPDYDSLELLRDSDLEIHLAAENLIQKVHSLYAQDVNAMEKRLAWLHSSDKIDSEFIPFGADAIVRSYAKTTEVIDLTLEIQLILLKLFDLHCIHNLADLYLSINQLFLSENVLPVIPHSPIKHETSPSAAQHIAQPGQSEALSTQPGVPGLQQAGMPGSPGNFAASPMWGQLQNMLNVQRQGMYAGAQMPSAGVAGAGIGQHTLAGAQMFTPMTTHDVLSSLSEIQTGAVDQLPQGGAHAVGNFLRVHLESAAQEGEQKKTLNPVDNDLIDVVCLIFEYILDDPHLPMAAKASIGRLQIPMLKVAMLDKDFFSMNGHPARYLLNLLASTAVGIDDDEAHDHPVLNKINEIVEHILENFSDDIGLFEEQTEQLNNFISEHHEQEQEACHDLDKQQQEKEELVLARAWVKETLSQHLIGRELAKPIVDIILGPWKDVMLETYLQEGERSQLWKTQIRFIDVLCWSVEPKKHNLDKKKLGTIIQQLVSTLREGLERINCSQDAVNRIFSTLEPYHLASVHGLALEDCILMSQDKESISDVLKENSEQEILNEEIERIIADEKIILEDIVLEDWEPNSDLEAINDEYLMLARHMEMGKWVEFKNSSGKAKRAKLAWKSELLGEYTFLNWKFDVVADKTLLELAEDLRQGTAKIVDDVPLMDRALSAVVSSLIPKESKSN